MQRGLVRVTVLDADVPKESSIFPGKTEFVVGVALGSEGDAPEWRPVGTTAPDAQPTWEHTFEPQAFESGEQLQLSLYGKSRWTRKDQLLGSGTLAISSDFVVRREVEEDVPVFRVSRLRKSGAVGLVRVALYFAAPRGERANRHRAEAERARGGVPRPLMLADRTPGPAHTAAHGPLMLGDRTPGVAPAAALALLPPAARGAEPRARRLSFEEARQQQRAAPPGGSPSRKEWRAALVEHQYWRRGTPPCCPLWHYCGHGVRNSLARLLCLATCCPARHLEPPRGLDPSLRPR